MTICPNSNKKFDSFLSKIIDPKLSASENAYQRRRVYYTVCILIRLAIAGLLLQLKDKKWVPYVVAIISLYATINVGIYSKEDNQWWSNKFQVAISSLMFIFSVLIILKVKQIPTWSLALLMFISVFGGVFQSLLKPSC
jgi:CDP-diglyceride synthetase